MKKKKQINKKQKLNVGFGYTKDVNLVINLEMNIRSNAKQ